MNSGVIYMLFFWVTKGTFFKKFSLIKEMGNLHFSGARQAHVTE